MSVRTVVVGLIVREEDNFVLMALRHPSGSRPNLWELPGGKVHRKEDLPTALRREMLEELGVKVEVGERLAGAVLDLEDLFMLDLYVCRIVSGEPQPLVATTLEWVDFDDAVVRRPLVPSSYLFYAPVRKYLARLRAQSKTGS